MLPSHSTKAPLAWTLVKVLVRWSAPYLQPHTEDSGFLLMLLNFCLHPHRKSAHFKQQVFLPTAGGGAQEHLCIHTSRLLYAIWARWIQSAEKAEIRLCIQAKHSSYFLKNRRSSHICNVGCWINETFSPGRNLLPMWRHLLTNPASIRGIL